MYCGSIGPQYRLDEMLAFHRVVRAVRPDARFTLLTKATVSAAEPGVEVIAVPTAEIPAWHAAADLGISWRTPSFSMAGVCPIKVAEYLLAGLPVLGNTGIGDQDALLGPPAALLLPALGAPDLQRAAAWWLEDVIPHREEISAAARNLGERAFGLGAVARATAEALA
jgi:hypothetical protein